jgi:hypothetical protein
LVILSVFALSACARVHIRDGEWCGDMGDVGASCFHTLTDATRDLDKPSWDAERFGMLCTKAENFAELKKAVLKLCKLSRDCTFDDVQAVQNFFDKAATHVR